MRLKSFAGAALSLVLFGGGSAMAQSANTTITQPDGTTVATEILGLNAMRIRITGGGGNSRLWCRIQADMLGVPGERYLADVSATWEYHFRLDLAGTL